MDLDILYENRQTEKKDQIVNHIHLNIEVSRHLQEGGQRAVRIALWFVLSSWWVFVCLGFPKTRLGVRLGVRQAGPGLGWQQCKESCHSDPRDRFTLWRKRRRDKERVAAWPPGAGSAGEEGGGSAAETQGGGRKAEGVSVTRPALSGPLCGQEPCLLSHPPGRPQIPPRPPPPLTPGNGTERSARVAPEIFTIANEIQTTF